MLNAETIATEDEAASSASRILAAAGAATMIGASGAVAYFDPSKSNLLPLCPLFSLTGFACPGCGLTRGFHSLFNGDIIPALDFNILIPLWAVLFAWIFVSLVLTTARGRGLTMWPTYPKFLWGFMIVLIGFGILRNIPVWPLTILFP